RVFIQGQAQAARRFVSVGFAHVIVEQYQGAVGVASGRVLPFEHRVVGHVEVAVRPTQRPDDLTGLPVEFIDRVGVTGRDEYVAVVIQGGRVDVEVVKRFCTAAFVAL